MELMTTGLEKLDVAARVDRITQLRILPLR